MKLVYAACFISLQGLIQRSVPLTERPDNVSAAACYTDWPTARPAVLGERQRLLVWAHAPNGLAAHPRPHRAHFHPDRFPIPDEYLEPRHFQRP